MHLSAWAWSQAHWSFDAAGSDPSDSQGVPLSTLWRQEAHGVESIIRSVSKPWSPSEDAIGKSLAPIPESEAELEEEEEDEDEAEPERDEAKEQGDTSLPESEEEREGEEEEEDKDEDETELKRDEAQEQVDKNLKEDKKDRTDVVRIDQKAEPETTTTNVRVYAPQTLSKKDSSEQDSKGWQAIPKPKGHSNLDYSRWDRVEDDSSEDDDDDEDDDEESQPQYRFRLRTVGVRPVK